MFILTTIDAGTRVGRFLVQDLLGIFSPRLGDTRTFAGNMAATLLFVGAWGWFLYQGVIDPLGGINSLWPIFGVANQLLGVMAFSLGTTVLIKMGRKRYAWVTLAPLAWLLAVTMTAGWMKIFSDAPIGFLAIARGLQAKISAGGSRQSKWRCGRRRFLITTLMQVSRVCFLCWCWSSSPPVRGGGGNCCFRTANCRSARSSLWCPWRVRWPENN